MCYNNGMDEEEGSDVIEEAVIPYIRIYIAAGKPNHDMLNIDEILNMLTQDGKSPSENIKDIIDKGMVNIFATSYSATVKIL